MKNRVLKSLAAVSIAGAIMSFIGATAQEPDPKVPTVEPKLADVRKLEGSIYTPVVVKLVGSSPVPSARLASKAAPKVQATAKLLSAHSTEVSFTVAGMPANFSGTYAVLPVKCYAVTLENNSGLFRVTHPDEDPLPVFGGATSVNLYFSNSVLSQTVTLTLDPAVSRHFFVGTLKAVTQGDNSFYWEGGTLITVPAE